MNTVLSPFFALLRLLLMAGVLAALTAHAHAPFDHSSRLTVGETKLELTVTMGGDAAVQFLTNCGVDSNLALSVTRESAARPLSLEVAARIYEVRAGGKPLAAEKLTAFTEGLETLFIVVYPRPDGGVLDLRALFFNGIEPMKTGAFVAEDESGMQLGSALLSRRNDSIQVPLPPRPEVRSQKSEVGNPPAAAQPRFGEFLRLGLEHILTGYDHLLFLCGLLVVCRRVGPMLAIITCFTLAHSLTLALAALGLVQISPRLTEPLIALTIVFVGVENFRGVVNTKTRCGLALGFGLIHGFGFASALQATGLGGTGMALAKPLLAFNLGVECGQLAVAAVFLPVLFALRKIPWFARYGEQIVSALVVGLGGFWLVQRLLL